MILLSVILALTGFALAQNGFPTIGGFMFFFAFCLWIGNSQPPRKHGPVVRACDIAAHPLELMDRREDPPGVLGGLLMRRARLLLDDLAAGRDPEFSARRLNAALIEAERRTGKKDVNVP